MKVLVINGSPRGANGNTETLVRAFLEGVGVEAETIYLKDKKINHCSGCFGCWVTTPGVCIHHDDMPELLEKVKEADIVVYATPLYIYTVSGLTKDFMDRLLPLAQPFIRVENGLCNHPGRYEESKKRSAVVISNCGFPEQDHFSGLKETMNRCFRESDELAGMICCAGGELLRVPGIKDAMTWYLDAVRQAGREVVASRKISPETQSILDKPLMKDQTLWAEMTNAHWRSLGLRPVGEEETAESTPQGEVNAVPLGPPASMETMKDLIAGMALVFNPEAAGDMKAIIQFDTDEQPGKYFLDIADGKCTAYEGTHPKPTATITTPADVWLSIAQGKLNGGNAFITGKYKVSGDIRMLTRLQKLFPSRQ